MIFVSNEDYDEASMETNHPSTDYNFSISRTKRERIFCAICGAKATGINFDVLTCSSCKAFFRRNGIKPLEQFVCRLSGDCKVDERSRRQCTACRLKKCFAMGMIKERIRTQEQNERHRALVEENRKQKLKKLQEKRFFPDYESNEQEPERRRRQTSSTKTNEIVTTRNPSNHIDFMFDLFIENTQQILPEDFQLELDNDITHVLNLHCLPISSLITFLKQLALFQQLPVDDRLILLKNNTKILLPILISLLNSTFDVQYPVNQSGFKNLNHKLAQAYSMFDDLIPDDNKFLLILITVLLFCPSLFTTESLIDAGFINDPSRQLINYAYDEYAQLLWYYVQEKYADDEQQATIIYTKIITTSLRSQLVVSEIYDFIECSVQIDQLHMLMQSILHLT